ncbi:MAG: exo-alpha-sialidase, partial [Phycisphaerales bacterium]|nr:exo-alpha-sialidase [Phycisphaerales bacterium]
LDGIQDFTVSVNSGPNLLFVNTPSVKVNAGAGNDQIILQAPAPNLAAWNVAVTIDGGVPSINDQLVVIAPGKDQATYTPTSANSGTLGVANSSGTVTSVSVTNIENFIYDGQSDGDTFTTVGTSGANAFTLTPGATNDAGTLGMDSTLPVTFQNLGTSGQVVVNGNGGADSLVYNGTAANDSFTIANSASPVVGGQINLNTRVPVLTQNIPTVSLEGRAGDDTFTLVPTILTSPYTTLNLDGGATASATGNQANLTAATSSALSISGQTIKQGGKTVAGTSLQNINLNGAGNDLTYNGVAGVTEAINFIASPIAGQGQVSIPNVALWSYIAVPVVNANGKAADNDTLTFTGTNNSDVYQIHLEAAGTDAAPVLKLQNATAVNTLLTLGNYTGFSTLNVSGLDGADTYNVYAATTAPSDPNLPGGRNLFINGNLPSGKKKLTNVMHIFYGTKRPTIVQTVATQNPTSGQVQLNYGTALFLIGYAGIQNVTIAK